MKIDSKMRRIQQKYRNEISLKNKKGKNAIEVICIIFFIILLIYFGAEFPIIESDYNQFTEIEDFEKRWMTVTRLIDDDIKNSSSEYVGIAIDFKPKPIKIIIKTSLEKLKLNDDDNLNEYINIANEKIMTYIENDSYEIIVTGKNKEEITSKVFTNDS
ncbi:hypothetical protein [Metabacillus malikii]|uniref:Uncharacterized protein n=1 Tax=Metabacillus malikii TaxID=1504265 RepID=A0ABT9ZAD0_9BACI|nr:hypothetical protein [Metabacillus malikii]MDQ0229201.1 hypothetical protein [Metabacillus malikii]